MTSRGSSAASSDSSVHCGRFHQRGDALGRVGRAGMIESVGSDGKNFYVAIKCAVPTRDAILAQKNSIEPQSAALRLLQQMIAFNGDEAVLADRRMQQSLTQILQPRILAAADNFSGSGGHKVRHTSRFYAVRVAEPRP